MKNKKHTCLLKNRRLPSLKFTSELWAQIFHRHFVTVHLIDPHSDKDVVGLFWNYTNASQWLDTCYHTLKEKGLDAFVIIDFDGEVVTTFRVNFIGDHDE